MTNPIIGIDLGTTNSVVSTLVGKNAQTILVDSAKLLPSVVCFTESRFIVGQMAKNMAILEPENTVVSVKRKMGQDILLEVGGKKMSPEDISSLILKKIKEATIEQLDLDRTLPFRTVITVPAYFTEEQRVATKHAAELAEMQVERIINEPTAAALAFGMSSLDEAIYAMYDLGGGTFDISVIESMDGLVEVLATKGDNQLGGDDFDKLLMEDLWKQFVQKNKLGNIPRSRKEEARLMRIAEQTKIKLSSEEVATVQESFFLKHKNINYHLEMQVPRVWFESLIEPAIQKTVNALKEAISIAKLKTGDLDGIILVGGSSRIPLISQMIQSQLGIEATLIDLPDEAVSHGATIQGAIIDHKDIDTVLIDITPHSLGIAVMDDTSYEKMYTIYSKDFKKDTDLDLGVGVVIPRNTPIPVKKKKKFSAASAFQKGYEIQVYQGESGRYDNNHEIGVSLLKVENPIEHGVIEVTFELDINGLLKITAEETTTKEAIKAEFKSSKGKKILKNKLNNELKLSEEKSDDMLIQRAHNLLNNAELENEDKKELEEVIAKYEQHQKSGDSNALTTTENELLDLLYYLEENED